MSVFTHRIELRRDTVLSTMADALGEQARFRPDGEPSHWNLLGDNDSGTGSNLATGKHRPSGEAMATIGVRLAVAQGMTEFDEDQAWAAIRKTHRIVPIGAELEAAA